jgi:hypothetical protein
MALRVLARIGRRLTTTRRALRVAPKHFRYPVMAALKHPRGKSRILRAVRAIGRVKVHARDARQAVRDLRQLQRVMVPGVSGMRRAARVTAALQHPAVGAPYVALQAAKAGGLLTGVGRRAMTRLARFQRVHGVEAARAPGRVRAYYGRLNVRSSRRLQGALQTSRSTYHTVRRLRARMIRVAKGRSVVGRRARLLAELKKAPGGIGEAVRRKEMRIRLFRASIRKNIAASRAARLSRGSATEEDFTAAFEALNRRIRRKKPFMAGVAYGQIRNRRRRALGDFRESIFARL